MRKLSRLLLSLAALGLPWVIAACYGTLWKYSKDGRVIDATTQAGIQGIEVDCNKNGAIQSSEYSDTNGQVFLGYDIPCDTLTARDTRDTDGATLQLYETTTIPFDPNADTFTIRMAPKAQP